MKAIRSIIAGMVTASLFLFIVTNFVGCSQESPLQGPLNSNHELSDLSFAKKNNNKGKRNNNTNQSSETAAANNGSDYQVASYTDQGSVTLAYDPEINGYQDGKIEFGNKSSFKVKAASLTPPAGHPDKEPVTIIMTVNYDAQTNEMNYEFGPSGCQFDKPAYLTLDYSDLSGKKTPTLYLLNKNGEWEKENPDGVDRKYKKMYVEIRHFSRYAIAFSK